MRALNEHLPLNLLMFGEQRAQFFLYHRRLFYLVPAYQLHPQPLFGVDLTLERALVFKQQRVYSLANVGARRAEDLQQISPASAFAGFNGKSVVTRRRPAVAEPHE